MARRELRLSFAPDHSLLRVVRLAASSLATDAGLNVAEIDDLALAVDELTAALLDVAGEDVTVAISSDDVGVTVRGSTPGDAELELGPLATTILERTVDRFVVGGGEGVSFSLAKLRADVG